MRQYQYVCARDLFEAARDAARDVRTIRRQLERLEADALRIGSPSFSPRVRGSHGRGAMAERVGALVDREAALHRREEDDYQLIDLTTWVLYGRDNEGGLASLAPAWWADALWWFYLGLETWENVGAIVGYSAQHARRAVQPAFDVIDANGVVATMEGIGAAT